MSLDDKRWGAGMVFYAAAITAAAVACVVWRANDFLMIEPRQDHAFYTQWIQSLRAAERLLPHVAEGQGWLSALKTDEGSALNILLRPIYAANLMIFNVVNVGFFWALSLIVGATMRSQVLISILAATAMLWVLAVFPLLTQAAPGRQREKMAIGAVAFAVGATSSFLHLFSALGQHNVGLLLMVLSVALNARSIARWQSLPRPSRVPGIWLATLAVQTAAVYAHNINAYLVPAATFLALLAASAHSWRSRLAAAGVYSAVTAATFLPVIAILLFATPEPVHADQSIFGWLRYYMEGGTTLHDFGERMLSWFTIHAEVFSPAGLGLGLAGLVGMAVRDRLAVPLALVAAHWMLWVAMPDFSGNWDRVSSYVLPLLFLGAAWAIVVAVAVVLQLRSRGRHPGAAAVIAALVALVLLPIHVAVEVPRLSQPRSVKGWGTYLAVQGHWRPMIAEIETIIPPGGVLVPWNYGLSHKFRSLSARVRRDMHVTRPLATMLDRWGEGVLRRYIAQRGLGLDPAAAMFVLVPGDVAPAALADGLSAVFGAEGFGLGGSAVPRLVGTWRRRSVDGGQLPRAGMRLYAVRWERERQT